MSMWADLIGVIGGFLRLGFSGPRLKGSGGALHVRNAADSAFADTFTATVYGGSGSGDSLNLRDTSHATPGSITIHAGLIDILSTDTVLRIEAATALECFSDGDVSFQAGSTGFITFGFSGGPSWDWPTADGDPGDVLTTDGAGGLTFGPAAGGADESIVAGHVFLRI